MIEILKPFLVALAIGIVIGIERERTKSKDGTNSSFGVRTITIITLLGALTAHIGTTFIQAMVGSFVVIVITAGYVRKCVATKFLQAGLTSETAALTTYVLGYLAYHDGQLAIILAIMLLVLLAAKERVHSFAHTGISEKEMTAALVFLVIAFVILPLLPNHYIDPWSLINPTKIWVLFVLISGVEFGAYIAGRALGGGSGIILVGLFGGLVSATTTTLNLAARTRKTNSPGRLVVSSIVLAEVASMLMQLITLHTIAPIASTKLSMILIAPCLLGLIIAVGLLTVRKNGSTRQAKTINLHLDNPLTLKRTATFALVISLSLIVVTLIVRLFGTDGIYLTSVIGGVFSVRAITLAIGSVANSGGIPIEAASLAILLALTTNMVAKLVLIHRVGSGRLLAICAPILMLMLASGLAVHWWNPLGF
ncbi:MAG: MgtC/SapB family protein [Rhodospirillaceae bacterium]|jgi:uncharacterized membrane protein (DUF4010 family)|nr:MgtC/SapB family protein [Rhodospirillaceae bacterium]